MLNSRATLLGKGLSLPDVKGENRVKGWVWVLAAALVWSCGEGGVGEHAALADGTTIDSMAVDSSAAWETVQEILMGTKDIVVLDGIKKAPLRVGEGAARDYGDWMVRFMLADPEKLNPVTASDAGASQVLENVFESLLNPEYDPPYKLRGWV